MVKVPAFLQEGLLDGQKKSDWSKKWKILASCYALIIQGCWLDGYPRKRAFFSKGLCIYGG